MLNILGLPNGKRNCHNLVSDHISGIMKAFLKASSIKFLQILQIAISSMTFTVIDPSVVSVISR